MEVWSSCRPHGGAEMEAEGEVAGGGLTPWG